MRHLFFVPLALLAASFCAFGSIDSGLLALVPSSAKVVGGFDVTTSRNSEFGRYLLAKSQMEDPHLQELMAETGFDPRRDLESLVFASGDPNAANHQNSFAVLARGTFDEQRIMAHAQAKGATVQSFHGIQMLINQSKNEHTPHEQTAIAFLGAGVAALADVATLQQIILNRSASSVLDPAMQSKIDDVGSKNDIWFAALTGSDFLGNHFSPDNGNGKVLQSVVQSSGGARLGPTIDVTFHAVTRSAQDANALADVAHFMASMLQMQRQNDKRADLMASSLDTMSVLTAGNVVDFALSMPEKNLEQIADLAPKGGHPRTKLGNQ
jgi:hypothetical protein